MEFSVANILCGIIDVKDGQNTMQEKFSDLED